MQMVEGIRLTIVDWRGFMKGLNKIILGLGGNLETTTTIMKLSRDLESIDNFETKNI
jgi:hypothetical protein